MVTVLVHLISSTTLNIAILTYALSELHQHLEKSVAFDAADLRECLMCIAPLLAALRTASTATMVQLWQAHIALKGEHLVAALYEKFSSYTFQDAPDGACTTVSSRQVH